MGRPIHEYDITGSCLPLISEGALAAFYGIHATPKKDDKEHAYRIVRGMLEGNNTAFSAFLTEKAIAEGTRLTADMNGKDSIVKSCIRYGTLVYALLGEHAQRAALFSGLDGFTPDGLPLISEDIGRAASVTGGLANQVMVRENQNAQLALMRLLYHDANTKMREEGMTPQEGILLKSAGKSIMEYMYDLLRQSGERLAREHGMAGITQRQHPFSYAARRALRMAENIEQYEKAGYLRDLINELDAPLTKNL